MKMLWILGLASSLVFGLSANAGAQVRIGVAGPLTGPSAGYGDQLKSGAELAREKFNAAGGILGQRIELEYGDDAADPRQAVSVANRFSSGGIKLVVGHINSG